MGGFVQTEPCIGEHGQQGFVAGTEEGVRLCMSRTQKRINGFSGKGSWGQRLRRHILHLCCRVLDEQMMGKRPATVSAERGQSPVNGSRSSPIIALPSHAPVPQVLIPEQ